VGGNGNIMISVGEVSLHPVHLNAFDIHDQLESFVTFYKDPKWAVSGGPASGLQAHRLDNRLSYTIVIQINKHDPAVCRDASQFLLTGNLKVSH